MFSKIYQNESVHLQQIYIQVLANLKSEIQNLRA
jgi:hypothetical protein